MTKISAGDWDQSQLPSNLTSHIRARGELIIFKVVF